MGSFVDHLKCPICFEIPDGKVFQCKNGHTFCSQCNTRLKHCPQCRVVLGFERIRNRTLEQILDSTRFACPNKGLGCERVLGRGDIAAHLLHCKFEPFYFCKLIGFENCPYNALCSLHGNPNDLATHLKQAHPEIQETIVESSSPDIITNAWIHLNYENFVCRANKLEKGTVAIWTPHLIRVKPDKHLLASENQNDDNEDGGPLLLILCQISEPTKNAAWICLSMSLDTKLVNGQQKLIDVSNPSTSPATTANNKQNINTEVIEYQLRGQRGCGLYSVDQDQDEEDDDKLGLLTPKMTWKAPVLTFKDIDKDLENFALRVPICLINSFNNAKGDLTITVKMNGKRSQKNVQLEEQRYSLNRTITNVPELTSFVTNKTFQLAKPQCPSHWPNGSDQQASGDDDDDEIRVVFGDVYCNGCGQRPVVSVRYKCLQCIDYDLCKECMERGDTHMHHVFARIHSLRQNELFNWKHRLRMMKGRSSYI